MLETWTDTKSYIRDFVYAKIWCHLILSVSIYTLANFQIDGSETDQYKQQKQLQSLQKILEKHKNR